MAVDYRKRARPVPSPMPETGNLNPVAVFVASNESETRAIGAGLATKLAAGDVVLLDGPLGAGKTTLVRGLLFELGHADPVRSPTYNLLQTFSTTPPVLHADLYRVESAVGIGIEDYLASHLCLVEWPDRLHGLIDPRESWRVSIEFSDVGRRIVVEPPDAPSGTFVQN